MSDSSVTVLVANNHGSVSQTFRVAVEAVGEPPRLVTQIPDQVFETGSGDQVVETAFYFDGEELQYSVSGSSRVSINTTTGRLTYSTGLQASDSGVTVSVANNFGSVSQTFRVVVEAVGEPPRAVAEIPDQVFEAASGDQVVETASYFEGEELNYGVSGSSLASINANTGRLIYSTGSQASDSGVTVSVANNFGSVSQTFRVIVQAVDNPPRVVAQIQDLIFDMYSGDQEIETAPYFEGERLWFSVNGPEGVTIDATTGRVSIDTDRGWTSGTITVTAHNSGGSAASSFQITLEREDTGTEPDYTPAATELRTSVEKDGVTFFFNEPAQVGRYCTGDWFVVMQPGLKLTATNPACRRVENTDDTHAFTYAGRNLIGRYVHGLQIDPSDADKQGFDSYAAQASTNRIHRGVRAPISIPSGPSIFQADWSPALNMDPAFVMDGNAVSDPTHAMSTPRGPVSLDRPMSLVKAISRAVAHEHGRGGQEMLVALTVVAEVPPEGAFRPPMGGPAVDLPVTWTEAGVQPFL
ncbi:hypothetical protein, partial [Pararhodobacter sp. SW119]|uniref:hypothetical protein n=1 Tax=Pararhodobacter sp. SW119 TaxID=2780075 RepID=UPI001ADF71B2